MDFVRIWIGGASIATEARRSVPHEPLEQRRSALIRPFPWAFWLQANAIGAIWLAWIIVTSSGKSFLLAWFDFKSANAAIGESILLASLTLV